MMFCGTRVSNLDVGGAANVNPLAKIEVDCGRRSGCLFFNYIHSVGRSDAAKTVEWDVRRTLGGLKFDQIFLRKLLTDSQGPHYNEPLGPKLGQRP